MKKTIYYFILTLSFGLLLVDYIWATLTGGPILPAIAPILPTFGLLLSFFICSMQVWMMKQQLFRVIGAVLMVVLLFGTTFKIMHWPYANMLMMVGGAGLVLVMLISAIFDQVRDVIQYLAIAYIFIRVLKIIHLTSAVSDWVGIVLIPAIFLAGLVTIAMSQNQFRKM